MKRPFYNSFLILIILVCLFFISTNNFALSAKITEGSTVSNVSVQRSLAISFSQGLSEGIKFGTVNVLPAENVSALLNEDGVENSSLYYIRVSEDSNTNADFCIKAGEDLTSLDLDTLGLGNETYASSNFSNLTTPSLEEEVSLTTSYVKSGDDLEGGSNNYYRFWLDIPGGQPSGDYNNTLYFKGIQSGSGC